MVFWGMGPAVTGVGVKRNMANSAERGQNSLRGEMAEPEAQFEVLGQRAAQELDRLALRGLKPALYVVATPIGNLGDITLRALATLALADVIYCEDTRHSRALLAHYSISRPLRSYHEHNASSERPRIVDALKEGKCLALISDAGTPLISDPGYKLVRDIIEAGHDVIALPGPSAALAALASAGVPTDSFFFAGFTGSKQGARRARLGALKDVPGTLVFYESPSRLAAALADIAEVLGEREVVVARELTKLHEEIRRGSAVELVAWVRETKIKGEIVILVAPPLPTSIDDDQITLRLIDALHDLSLRDAAKQIAADLNVARSRVYDLGLTLKKRG